ncbi:MAG: lipoprotein signal peptidase [Chitinophagaceae bacterium]
MKFRNVILIAIALVLLDQVFKIYVKTHFTYNEEINVLGSWFKLHFIENEGMAFGMKFGDDFGKIFLTVFRLIAVIWGVFFIKNTLIKKQFHRGLILCSTLILAGAVGNLMDSLFYAKIFTESSFHVARFVPWGQGYGAFLHGKVVDMLYFPVLKGTFPSWLPIWGGDDFEFFRPIFNIADACISTGVIAILLFQKRFFQKPTFQLHQNENNIESALPSSDVSV